MVSLPDPTNHIPVVRKRCSPIPKFHVQRKQSVKDETSRRQHSNKKQPKIFNSAQAMQTCIVSASRFLKMIAIPAPVTKNPNKEIVEKKIKKCHSVGVSGKVVCTQNPPRKKGKINSKGHEHATSSSNVTARVFCTSSVARPEKRNIGRRKYSSLPERRKRYRRKRM